MKEITHADGERCFPIAAYLSCSSQSWHHIDTSISRPVVIAGRSHEILIHPDNPSKGRDQGGGAAARQPDQPQRQEQQKKGQQQQGQAVKPCMTATSAVDAKQPGMSTEAADAAAGPDQTSKTQLQRHHSQQQQQPQDGTSPPITRSSSSASSHSSYSSCILDAEDAPKPKAAATAAGVSGAGIAKPFLQEFRDRGVAKEGAVAQSSTTKDQTWASAAAEGAAARVKAAQAAHAAAAAGAAAATGGGTGVAPLPIDAAAGSLHPIFAPSAAALKLTQPDAAPTTRPTSGLHQGQVHKQQGNLRNQQLHEDQQQKQRHEQQQHLQRHQQQPQQQRQQCGSGRGGAGAPASEMSEEVCDLPSPQLQREVMADEGVVYEIQILAVIPGGFRASMWA